MFLCILFASECFNIYAIDLQVWCSHVPRTVIRTSSIFCGTEKIMASLNVGLLSSRLEEVFFLVVRDPLRSW